MFSERLKEAMRSIQSSAGAFNYQNPEQFVSLLVFTYHVITASENLLKCGMEVTKEGKLFDYFKQHLEEETDHAKWLAADLATIGIDVEKLGATREAVQASGTAYWMLYHRHAACLLGYIAALELLPASLELVDALEQAYGKDLLRTFRFHAVHDIEHGNDLESLLDDLTAEEQEFALSAAIETTIYLQSALIANK